MKHFYHPEFFIEKCNIAIKKNIPSKEFYSKWALYYTRSSNRNFIQYKQDAEETRKLPFEITQQQWDWLTRSPCYLCGYQDAHGIGLDRVDNTIRKYTLENCRPCCGSCNSMKGEIPLQEFLDHCLLISSCNIVIEHISELKKLLKENKINPGNRIHWKSKGLYYAILSNTAESFQQSFKDVYTQDEFNTLCKLTKESSKEDALSLLDQRAFQTGTY